VARSSTILVGVAGALIGAAIVGLVWLLAGGDGSSESASVDRTPLVVPKRISAYSRLTDLPITQTAAGHQVAAHRVVIDKKTAEAVSKAYGGAAAIAVEYADPSLSLVPLLVAVRGASPTPWFPTQDLALDKVVKPADEVKKVGDVTCVIKNAPTKAGQKPAPQSAVLQSCMRSGPRLTVVLANVQSFAQPEQVAPLVDDAFAQLSKS